MTLDRIISDLTRKELRCRAMAACLVYDDPAAAFVLVAEANAYERRAKVYAMLTTTTRTEKSR